MTTEQQTPDIYRVDYWDANRGEWITGCEDANPGVVLSAYLGFRAQRWPMQLRIIHTCRERVSQLTGFQLQEACYGSR